MKRIIINCFLLLGALPSLAQDYDFSVKTNFVNIYYKIVDSSVSNRSVEVVPCATDMCPRPVAIPSTVTNGGKKYKVVSIGEKAFLNCTGATSITIPNSVTDIYNAAFRNTGISQLEIPESVTYIGDDAFANNVSLETVVFPNSVTEVGYDPFAGCEKLSHSIYNDKLYVKYIGEDSVLVVPDGITTICSNATNQYLSTTLGKTVQSKVRDIVLPESVEKLAKNAIYSSALKTITIKSAVPPVCGENAVIPASLISTATVYVSDADPTILERYKADSYWGNFNIVAIDLSGGSQDDGKQYVDVNHDDEANVSDVVAVYNFIVNGASSTLSKENVDVNADDLVNVADVVAIYNYIVNGTNPRKDM